MDILQRHEIFEIDVLERLNSAKLLEGLVFGGGTMLRLCHELNRYSVDLDFWFIKNVPEAEFFKKMRDHLGASYEVTDAQIKYHTILLELRSADHPKRLKIEVRKGKVECDYEERIAFSKYATKQVVLRVHTLPQMMTNKVEAALSRKEIRDFFDIEFLLRRGIPLPSDSQKLAGLKKAAASFNEKDFKVTLGSILEPDTRKYYAEKKFTYLLEKIESLGLS